MVLAVHVGGDRPADRDLPGAGQDRHPKSQRQQGPHQGVQADPRLDGHRRRLRLGVDVQDAVQLGQVERRAAGILRRVAVAAAQPSWDDASLLSALRRTETHRPPSRSRPGAPGSTLPRPHPCSGTIGCASGTEGLIGGTCSSSRSPLIGTPPPRSPRATPIRSLAKHDHAERRPRVRRRCLSRPRGRIAATPA